MRSGTCTRSGGELKGRCDNCKESRDEAGVLKAGWVVVVVQGGKPPCESV